MLMSRAVTGFTITPRGDKKMKRYLAILFALSLLFVSKAHSQTAPAQPTTGVLNLVQTIPLPTQGYMDRIAVDVKGQRLFISGEHNHTLVVVDLKAGKVIHQTPLAASAKKPVYLPDTNEIWVNLEDSSVVAINGTTYEITHTIPLTGFGDANRGGDNGAYDPNTHLFYAAVEVFTPDALEAFKGGIPIAYSGSDNHVPSGASIDIVDTKTAKMVGSIKMPGGDPAGVAMEPSGKKMYVTMGDIIDGESHVAVVDLDNLGGADDTVYYDEATGRIYCPGTTGTVGVFQEVDPFHFQLVAQVPTGAVSKSGLWVPEWKRFYSAVPQHFVLTAPHGSKDVMGDLRAELNQKEGTVLPMFSNLITEPA